MAIMCREMHWDFWTYMRQPASFLRTLWMMRKVEHEEKVVKEKLDRHANNGTTTHHLGTE